MANRPRLHHVYLLGLCLCFGDVSLSVDNPFYGKELFSTKTPYFWHRSNNTKITEAALKQCSLTYVDSVIRHGARFPGDDWILRFSELHKKLKTDSLLQTWTNRFEINNADQLSDLGKMEQFDIGRRFGERFKPLFIGKMDKIKSVSSHKQRTIDSSLFFSKGLAKSLDAEPQLIVNVQKKKMIRFYKYCDKWTESVEENRTAMMEFDKFSTGPELSSIMENVKNRLNTDKNIDIDEVETMQRICAFELGLYRQSEWCKYFETTDLEALDYWNDLEEYYESGYAYAINYQMSCPLIKDIFDQIQKSVDAIKSNTEYTVGTFRFGHSNTISPLYTALGLFKDTKPPTAENYRHQQRRVFRTSKILPFSANIAFVVYQCSGQDEFVLKVYVNEEEVTIPACNDVVCPLATVRRYLTDYIDHCDVDRLCSLTEDTTGAASVTAPSIVITIAAVILYIFR